MKRNIKFLTTCLLGLGLVFFLENCSSGGCSSDDQKALKERFKIKRH